MDNYKTIEEITELWRENKQRFVKVTTLAAYTMMAKKHILPAFGKCKYLEKEMIQEFVDMKLKMGLSTKTVRDIVAVLGMIQKFGTTNGILPPTTWNIRLPNDRQKNEPQVLTLGQQQKLFRYVKNNMNHRNLGICICLCTGMRIGEICALQWNDIDIETRTINIKHTLCRIYKGNHDTKHTEIHIGKAKTSSSIRSIPIDDNLYDIIIPLARNAVGYHYVISNNDKPTEPKILRDHYNKLLKQLSIPHIKFHGMRHSFATRCIENGCDCKTVSALLGALGFFRGSPSDHP